MHLQCNDVQLICLDPDTYWKTNLDPDLYWEKNPDLDP